MANINEVMFVKNPNNCLRFTDPLQQLGTKRFTKARWDEATKAYNLDFLVPKPKSDSGVEVVGSEAGESIDLNNTDGEEDDEEDEKDYAPSKGIDRDVEMKGGDKRQADEGYEEFNDDQANWSMKDVGKGAYSGGLNDNEWNDWQ
ncbi:hypothetical protein PCANC_03368 [Puccinia coronata f. sp. avenae]|uniref:Uncharacterized protein n=1 Tax=Puccinia coronata f. sp. avenae TaxID=200324 RepID=A0A2N5T8S7_9BASI|nr:hypothetical protein PCANC_03368 [Puccinia coronata f. sp. avenae]